MRIEQDAVEHMAQHFYIGDQACIKADRCGEFFSEPRGGSANQHVFAAKRCGGNVAAQNVDIGIGGER